MSLSILELSKTVPCWIKCILLYGYTENYIAMEIDVI